MGSAGLSSQSTCGSTSSSLLARLRAGENEAWGRLCSLYGPFVYRWARQAGLQASDAADIGQEVFRVVAQRVTEFKRENPGDSFRGWLWGITRNKLREYFRNRSQAVGGDDAHRLQQLADSLPDDSSLLEGAAAQTTLIRRVLEMIRGDFDEPTWTAFWRTTVDEQPATAVAIELGLSSGASFLFFELLANRAFRLDAVGNPVEAVNVIRGCHWHRAVEFDFGGPRNVGNHRFKVSTHASVKHLRHLGSGFHGGLVVDEVISGITALL